MSTGYACPVCDDPQADLGHLANHLGFTAMLHEDSTAAADGREDSTTAADGREDGHSDWLDEHVPDWSEYGEAELAAELADLTDQLEEREYPQVFEDTTGDDGHAPGRDDPAERSGALFDDDGGHDHGHSHQHGTGHDHGHGHDHATGQSDIPGGVETGTMPGGEIDDEEHEAIIEEAREMTQKLREGDEDTETDGEADADAGADGEEAAEADDE